MIDEELIQRIIDYLDGKLDEHETNRLKNELIDKNYDLDELRDLKQLSVQLDRLPQPQPSEKMSETFFQKLDNVSKSKFIALWQRLQIRRRAPQFAYAILLIFFGFLLGNWMRDDSSYQHELAMLSSEVRQMKQVVSLTLIQHPSPVQRMKAVNDMAHAPRNDNALIKVLLHTLNSDPNTNVRLATLEALHYYIGESEVRQGLIRSYSFQRSPLVLLALTDLIVESGEPDAVQSIQVLLSRKDLNVIVRQKLEQSLNKLI